MSVPQKINVDELLMIHNLFMSLPILGSETSEAHFVLYTSDHFVKLKQYSTV